MYLNLARKWRSKKFEEVIGQDFVIKVLKNCLYRNLISPVYLISGPKGCGKTTVARLFAAALNCENLLKFREDPKNISLPCSSCHSCILFNKSAHPDFIEIDAASNTGVENVRQIIDSSSFVPAIGSKRIYLIDEAHMLSKAAFNALLKTLEEPPASVLFILATTEVNKVIETVRSRCFQMFFMPIDKESLLNHLILICKTEEIEFDTEALDFIVQESHGSARDALNLLEKVRAGFNVVNKDTIFTALGLMPEDYLVNLLELIIDQNPNNIMTFYVEHKLDKFDQFIIFKKLVNLIYSAISLKMNLSSNVSEVSIHKLKALISAFPLDLFIKMLDLCYSFELVLLKTANPSILVQNLLIKLCLVSSQTTSGSSEKLTSNNSISASKTVTQILPKKVELVQNQTTNSPTVISSKTSQSQEWSTFLKALEGVNDPLVLSIFKQGVFKVTESNISLSFNKDLIFFKDWLENTKSVWRPLLTKAFPRSTGEIAIEFIFLKDIEIPVSAASVNQFNNEKKNFEKIDNRESFAGGPGSKKIEISVKPVTTEVNGNRIFKRNIEKVVAQDQNIPVDLNKFQKVNIISKIFPGKVTSSLAIHKILEEHNE